MQIKVRRSYFLLATKYADKSKEKLLATKYVDKSKEKLFATCYKVCRKK